MMINFSTLFEKWVSKSVATKKSDYQSRTSLLQPLNLGLWVSQGCAH